MELVATVVNLVLAITVKLPKLNLNWKWLIIVVRCILAVLIGS